MDGSTVAIVPCFGAMAWLVSDARVLASADVLTSRTDRRRGLLGRSAVDGAVVLEPCRWVHSVGMKFTIDVAYLDDDGTVLKMTTMRPHRIGLPVMAARRVIEADGGAFERWGLAVGDQVDVRDDET